MLQTRNTGAAQRSPATAPYARRPRTRRDCAGGQRPCPWISCSHHLAVDVTEDGGLRLNVPGPRRLPIIRPSSPTPPLAVWADHVVHALEHLPETCALDVADAGPVPRPAIGKLMGLSKERTRQLDERGTELMAMSLRHAGLTREVLLA